MPRRTVRLSLIIVHRTMKAVLVRDAEDAAGVWLPLKLIEVAGEPDGIGEVTMPEWLAIEKGLV